MKNPTRSLLFAAAIVLTLQAIQAAGYEEAADSIVASNPEVRAAYATVYADGLTLDVSNNLPDPEIEGELLFPERGGEKRWSVGVSQGFEWPGVYTARRRANRAAGAAAEATAEVLRSSLRAEALSALADYRNARANLNILETIAHDNDSLLRLTGRLAATGNTGRLDLNKLRIERERIGARVADWSDRLLQARGALEAIAGRDISQVLARFESADIRLEAPAPLDVWIAAARGSAAARAADMSVEAARLAGKAERAAGLPGFKIGYAHAFEEGNHFDGVSLGVSIPLFSGRGSKKRADAATAAARLDKEAVDGRLETEVRTAYESAAAAYRKIAPMREAVENSDNAALLKKALAGGQINLITYIQETNYFLEARAELLDLEYRYAKALATLRGLTR